MLPTSLTVYKQNTWYLPCIIEISLQISLKTLLIISNLWIFYQKLINWQFGKDLPAIFSIGIELIKNDSKLHLRHLLTEIGTTELSRKVEYGGVAQRWSREWGTYIKEGVALIVQVGVAVPEQAWRYPNSIHGGPGWPPIAIITSPNDLEDEF